MQLVLYQYRNTVGVSKSVLNLLLIIFTRSIIDRGAISSKVFVKLHKYKRQQVVADAIDKIVKCEVEVSARTMASTSSKHSQCLKRTINKLSQRSTSKLIVNR